MFRILIISTQVGVLAGNLELVNGITLSLFFYQMCQELEALEMAIYLLAANGSIELGVPIIGATIIETFGLVWRLKLQVILQARLGKGRFVLAVLVEKLRGLNCRCDKTVVSYLFFNILCVTVKVLLRRHILNGHTVIFLLILKSK